MKYIRSRPWRSRGPWFHNRAGARRRGYRDDELVPATFGTPDIDDDVVMHIEYEAPADDVLVPNTEDWPVAQRMLAERVDLSGLLALASQAPDRPRIDPDPETFVGFDWHAHVARSEDESAVSRHSA